MDSLNDLLNTPQGIVGAVIVAALGAALLFDGQQVKSHWREWASDFADALLKLGLVHLPKAFKALSRGDLTGAFRELKAAHDVIKDPVQRRAEFDAIVQARLEEDFKDPNRRAELRKKLDAAEDAFATGDFSKLASGLGNFVGGNATIAAAVKAAAPPPVAAGLGLLSHLKTLKGNPELASLVGILQASGLHDQVETLLHGHALADHEPAAPASSAPTGGKMVLVPDGHEVTLTPIAPTNAA